MYVGNVRMELHLQLVLVFQYVDWTGEEPEDEDATYIMVVIVLLASTHKHNATTIYPTKQHVPNQMD